MIQMSLQDAIRSDDSSINYVATLAAFLARLHPHKLELSPKKKRDRNRASRPSGPRQLSRWCPPMTKSPPSLVCLSMPADIQQLCSVLDGLSYYLKTLPNMARRLRPITRPYSSHNRKSRLRSPCGTRSPIERSYRSSAFPDWETMINKSRPLRLL